MERLGSRGWPNTLRRTLVRNAVTRVLRCRASWVILQCWTNPHDYDEGYTGLAASPRDRSGSPGPPFPRAIELCVLVLEKSYHHNDKKFRSHTSSVATQIPTRFWSSIPSPTCSGKRLTALSLRYVCGVGKRFLCISFEKISMFWSESVVWARFADSFCEICVCSSRR